MSMIRRVSPTFSPIIAFTKTEVQLLDRLVPDKDASGRKHISTYIVKLARLGGYLARSGDSPPGNMVVWRGLSRLTDIKIGFSLRVENVGN